MHGLSRSAVVPTGLSAHERGTTQSASCYFARQLQPCPPWSSGRESTLPSCPSLPLLQVWLNVSSLTPWLLDFHTVRFSGSSGCFLFLNLSLSLFWLFEEAQCIYLRLHLGQKLQFLIYLNELKFLTLMSLNVTVWYIF